MSQLTHPGNAAPDELRDARETERLSSYLRGMWQRRAYIWYVAQSDLKSKQMDSVLGNLWHLLNPLLLIGVYFLIFGVILDVQRGVDNFLGYLAVGVFMYGYTQKSATAGAKSLRKNRGLIQLVSFPRATLPITATVTEAIAMAGPITIMFVVALATGEVPQFSWLLVAPFLLLQTVFNVGLGLITARAVSHVADVQNILPFVFRLGAYLSGVLFNVTAYAEGSSYEILFRINPMYCFLEINRGAVLAGSPLDWTLVATAAAWTVALVVFGGWWFRRAEDTYGEG